MIRDFRRIVLLALALFCFQAACMGNLWAAEMKNESSASDLNNIGFMKNPPKALTEKFPMCDAFLNVKWIAPEKNIGYTHFEAIIKNKYGRFKGRKSVWALVDLDSQTIDYDVYQYNRKGRLQEIFNAVRNKWGRSRF